MKEARHRFKRLVEGVLATDRSGSLGQWFGALVGGRPLPRVLSRGAGMRTVAGVAAQPLTLLAKHGLDQESSPVELRLIARMLLQQGEVEAARLLYESLLARDPLNVRLQQEHARTLRALGSSGAQRISAEAAGGATPVAATEEAAESQVSAFAAPEVPDTQEENASVFGFAEGVLSWSIAPAALVPALVRGGAASAAPVSRAWPEDALTIRLVTSAWEGDEIRRQVVSSRGGLEGRWDVRPLLPLRGRLTAAVGVTIGHHFIAVRHLNPLRLP